MFFIRRCCPPRCDEQEPIVSAIFSRILTAVDRHGASTSGHQTDGTENGTGSAVGASHGQLLINTDAQKHTVYDATTATTMLKPRRTSAGGGRNNDVSESTPDEDRRTASVPIAKPQSKQVSIGIFGGPRVGKTAMASQFLWHVFTEQYKPTVEEFNWIEYDLSGAELMIKVIDLGGSNDFLAMRKLYGEQADAILLVFSVDDADSFTQMQEIYRDLKERNTKKAPMLLLANKIDLFSDEDQWAIDSADISQFLRTTKCPYTALSAKDESMVQLVFRQLLQQAEIRLMPSDTLVKRRQSMPIPCSDANGGVGDRYGGRSIGGATSLSAKDLARIRAAADAREKGSKRNGSCKLS